MNNLMGLQEYQENAARTCPDLGSYELNKLHMRMGVITEMGELLDIVKKHIAYGKPLDLVHIQEEIADVCWYLVNDLRLDKRVVITVREAGMQKEYPIQEFAKSIEFILREYLITGDSNQLIINLYVESTWLGLDFFKGLYNNIEKLRVRYPEKFTQENALNRNLDLERQKLEN